MGTLQGVGLSTSLKDLLQALDVRQVLSMSIEQGVPLPASVCLPACLPLPAKC